jgi:Fe-S cluster assembly protein SufD
MDTIITDNSLKGKMITLFGENLRSNFSNDTEHIRNIRLQAIERFRELGFPSPTEEKWRSTNLGKTLMLEYVQHFAPLEKDIDVRKVFQCEVFDLDTILVAQYNGWLVNKGETLTSLPDGTIIGSLADAMRQYPEIFEKHYGKYADMQHDGLNALNTAFAQDGLFIYVPEGVAVEKPVQIINLIDVKENFFVQPRNLIVLEKGASLKLVHCDHSLRHKESLINNVSEFFVGEGASLDHYKIQNKDNSSTLITTTFFHQEKESRMSTNTIVLHGGVVRNNISVKLAGEYADADILGLYLVDREQHVDTHVHVDHAVPHCTSNEMFKGILDDQASGVFNGHILVRRDAQKTLAYQNNRNLLLTDKARIHTKPHLEIYADDVKCSHGATVGQLDPEAMFYLRTRGIGEHAARMLLMYAFAAEVIRRISIEALRERIDELVAKRLRGELTICDQCVIDCREKRPVSFDIDLSKI